VARKGTRVGIRHNKADGVKLLEGFPDRDV